MQSTDRNSSTLCGFRCADFRETHKSEALQAAPVPNFTEIGKKYGPWSKISFTPLGVNETTELKGIGTFLYYDRDLRS